MGQEVRARQVSGRVRDWTYRDARRRLIRHGRRHLRNHTATPILDDQGNRLVACSCGWRGNAFGWAGHLDHVVSGAIAD